MNEIKNLFNHSKDDLVNQALLLLTVLVILVVGWLLSKLAKKLTIKLLSKSGLEIFQQPIETKEHSQSLSSQLNLTLIIATFFQWTILILTLLTVTDLLNWNFLSKELGQLLSYLPNLFSALVILVVGIYLARIVRDFFNITSRTLDISIGPLLGNTIYYFILINVFLTALNQAGIKIDLLKEHASLIFGAFLCTISLAYGIAARDTVLNLISILHYKTKIKVGRRIKLNSEDLGKVVDINRSILITEKEAGVKTVTPLRKLLNQRLEVFY